MKKILSLILALVMCLGMCACASNGKDIKNTEENEPEAEVISIDTLLSDLDNLARAEQNVGKATHLFGTIEFIGTEALKLKHIFIERSFSIPMDSAVLAELNKGDYIAIYAVVDEIGSGGYFKFKNAKQVDMKLMDEYVVNAVSTYSINDLIKTHSDVIENYVVSRGDTFKMTDDNKIASYIVGKWYWPYHMGISGTYISDLEYFADGECIWSAWDNYRGKWKDAYCSWSVKDGIFYGCGDDTAVYKISENAMVTADNLYIRGESSK